MGQGELRLLSFLGRWDEKADPPYAVPLEGLQRLTGSNAQYGKEDRPTMDGSREQPKATAGLDLGDKYSYLCLIDTLSGKVIEEGRLPTSPEALRHRFASERPMRIAITLSGTLILGSPGTKILSNDIIRSGEAGIAMFGPERVSNVGKVVGNHISGGAWGILLQLANGGTFAGNTIRNNCAGMMIESFGFDEPVVGLEVKGNTVENNTRSCRAAKLDRNFSGIGIALFSTRDMEVTANHLSGNIPSGPTPVSGRVVVAVNPYDDTAPKPTNNSVTGNHFGRNKPDIFWDETGSGNRFLGNLCDTSVPSTLCN
jgi:parallel beta-helix repeat protein